MTDFDPTADPDPDPPGVRRRPRPRSQRLLDGEADWDSPARRRTTGPAVRLSGGAGAGPVPFACVVLPVVVPAELAAANI